jgi:hypothetical protein
VDKVLQVHGAMGYSRELPVERWYRELRVARIYEGTDEIQRRTIAREVLGGRYVPGHHVTSHDVTGHDVTGHHVTGIEPARS